MVKLVNAVMLERRVWSTRLLFAAISFVFLLTASVGLVGAWFYASLDAARRETLQHYLTIDGKVKRSLNDLRAQVTAEPCSAEFRAQLRRFAYSPDGLNEFFYAPNGAIQCSVNTERFDPPILLGVPNIPQGQFSRSSMWLDLNLRVIGLDGLEGTIVLQDKLAVVVPTDAQDVATPDWMRLEAVIKGTYGRWWHRSGENWLYHNALRSSVALEGWKPSDLFRQMLCDDVSRYCVVSVGDPIRFASAHKTTAFVGMLALLALSYLGGTLLQEGFRRYYSFENRFRRHLSPETVVCAYQPIMDLRTGGMVGCEVLARWRDVDGSVVGPDRFIPLVEKHGLTIEFTRIVVDKAFRELAAALPKDLDLQVTFNVFPCDLGNTKLPSVFERIPGRERFAVVAEIVESAAFVASEARAQVEALHRLGVTVYLDDFGSGYSNLQNLASLPIGGVKLDRAFAMAPDDSLMARMLPQTIDLISFTGRVIVVEGVETEARLQTLRALGQVVDRVQGYHVSRPLGVDAFAAFMAEEDLRSRSVAAAA